MDPEKILDYLFYFCEIAIVFLVEIALNLEIVLGSMDISMMLILPIHLFVFSLISSVSYNFSSRGLFTSLVKFILGIFFFEAIVNEIAFLVSLSGSSLLVYKNATEFWKFILYPATLLNSLINSSSFLVESLGFST